jgi:hypothetical protein
MEHLLHGGAFFAAAEMTCAVRRVLVVREPMGRRRPPVAPPFPAPYVLALPSSRRPP